MSEVADGTLRRNLELKARLADPSQGERSAVSLGARSGGLLVQVDTYFNAPSGRLKLREIDGVEAQLISYDRPEDEAQRWSRFRVVAVGDPAATRVLLAEALGLRGTVRKRRHLYLWNDCRIHLDQVERLGSFIEFEVLSQGDDDADRSRMEILRQHFGLQDSDAIRASYSDLLGL